MAFKKVGQEYIKDREEWKEHFTADRTDEIASLPDCNPGSTCVVGDDTYEMQDTGVWTKQGGGSGGGVFVVTLDSIDPYTHTCSKTYQEIMDAFNAGMNVIGRKMSRETTYHISKIGDTDENFEYYKCVKFSAVINEYGTVYLREYTVYETGRPSRNDITLYDPEGGGSSMIYVTATFGDQDESGNIQVTLDKTYDDIRTLVDTGATVAIKAPGDTYATDIFYVTSIDTNSIIFSAFEMGPDMACFMTIGVTQTSCIAMPRYISFTAV